MSKVSPQPRPTRLETITVQRPRCPACKGFALRKYRSVRDNGKGIGLCWMRCLHEECARRFILKLI
jgi:hypothetical protein